MEPLPKWMIPIEPERGIDGTLYARYRVSVRHWTYWRDYLENTSHIWNHSRRAGIKSILRLLLKIARGR